MDEEKLASIVAAAVAQAMATAQAAAPTPAPESTPAQVGGARPDAPTETPLTLEALKDFMANQNNAASADLANSLFEDKLNETFSRNEAFKDFMNSEDEFGTPRMDRLNKITDYKERSEALAKISRSYSQAQMNAASNNNNGQPPAIPKKVQDAADKANKTYNDIDAQLEAGDISPEEHTKLTMAALDVEILQQV